MTEITWTPEELKEFDRLTWDVCSIHQMKRIEGRIAMPKFVEKHGKEKCDAMFAYLLEQDKRERF